MDDNTRKVTIDIIHLIRGLIADNVNPIEKILLDSKIKDLVEKIGKMEEEDIELLQVLLGEIRHKLNEEWKHD